MREFKYVILNNEFPHIFSLVTNHSMFKLMNPTSAGFGCIFKDENNNIKVSVYGESLTLKLKSKSNDAEILEHLLLSEY
jgi:hypothetical protein